MSSLLNFLSLHQFHYVLVEDCCLIKLFVGRYFSVFDNFEILDSIRKFVDAYFQFIEFFVPSSCKHPCIFL